MQDTYLSRVDLPLSLDGLLNTVCNRYKLGYLVNSTFIPEGYEELNIKITTVKGAYVVKVFSKARTQIQINDYVNGLISLSEHGVPTPKLVTYDSGVVYTIMLGDKHCSVCVMEFFDGHNFVTDKPTLADIRAVTQYLAKIHLVPLQVNPNYDSWSPANLVREFTDKQASLQAADKSACAQIVRELQQTDTESLTKSLLHGDLQKAHVLKNAQGQYCILDLGCMDHNACIIDLGIFLALFALDLDSDAAAHTEVYQAVIADYQKIHRLPEAELRSIPVFIAASYAAYIIAASNLKYAHHDENKPTNDWLNFGRQGLQKFPRLQQIILTV